MQAQTATQEWRELPSGLSVSTQRMRKGGRIFTLGGAANMDVEAFNKEARRYDVHIAETDPPIDRMVKYSIFLARKNSDSSFMPTNAQYVNMAIDIAVAKTRDQESTASFYHLAPFYKTLTGEMYWDATREIFEFQERVTEGPEKGKHIVKLFRYNEDGDLEMVDDRVTIAEKGWTRTLGPRYLYPSETSKQECSVEGLEFPLQGSDAKGYLHLGNEPEKGKQRLALRGPSWSGEWLLNVYLGEGRSYSLESVAALTMR